MMRRVFRMKRKVVRQVNLHETYTDSTFTTGEFFVQHGEGHLRQSVSVRQLRLLGFLFVLAMTVLVFRVGYLQIAEGGKYADISVNNTFDRVSVFPVRGDITDRNGKLLAWNVGDANDQVPLRHYRGEGFSSLLGFVRYPRKDTHGKYYHRETSGVGGAEELYDYELAGSSGSLVREKNASGSVMSELYINTPVEGGDVQLSVDADVQEMFYTAVKRVAEEREFKGGGGVLMDNRTGEIIALVSYPDFDSNVLTNYPESERGTYFSEQDGGVFINRAVSGLYTPGSTVKPFFAAAALEEEIVSPSDTIVSNGFITIRNPYDPDIVYTYKDWKAHGPLNIQEAIAWSSNVFFYHIGGGYGEMTRGLGIDRLHFYAGVFGLDRPTQLGVFAEPRGIMPNPKWKKEWYDETWRVGDTYNTVIGQYAFQVTPLQMARAMAALANNGYILEPHFERGRQSERIKINVSDANLGIVRGGMRRTVTEGTAKVLNTREYELAVKTGTAQIGNEGLVNSLLIGFFPYQNPMYTFVIVMERGEQDGAIAAAKLFFDVLVEKAPSYVGSGF